MEKKEGYKRAIIVLLQPTTRLRVAKHIDNGIVLIMEKSADSVVSVSQPMEKACDMVDWDSNGDMRFLYETMIGRGKIQPQGGADCYFLSGAIYPFTCYSFIETKRRFGKKVISHLMRQMDSIDTDSMDDLLLAEAILKKNKIDR